MAILSLHIVYYVAGLLLFFVLILNRKKLHIKLIKFFYGAYSCKYICLFKKYYFRSPFPYCFKEEFVHHGLFILDKNPALPILKSHKTISFGNIPFHYNFKSFLKEKGRPACFNVFSFEVPGFIIKAAGYPVKVDMKKATAVYYFMNDHFFMGEYIFKSISPLIKENLLSYYFENNQCVNDNFYIENSGKRIIHFQDTGFTIDIKFLCQEDDEIIQNLKKYYEKLSSKKVFEEV